MCFFGVVQAAYNIGGYIVSANAIEQSIFCFRTPRIGRVLTLLQQASTHRTCICGISWLDLKIILRKIYIDDVCYYQQKLFLEISGLQFISCPTYHFTDISWIESCIKDKTIQKSSHDFNRWSYLVLDFRSWCGCHCIYLENITKLCILSQPWCLFGSPKMVVKGKHVGRI